ncbi:hemerythrin domain-containing protein [Actinomadura sp. GC306]|uniref:hemerythrin domain-containing protein n=1 Tax=Actinomadura sp. GC306 TaxID=2530367 RepID=UPI00104DB05D|nr:hemerythrin domain-containing protein [Actinomadura sp. GC306]TDC67042.1 hemerythrin domain-containing protein [Actinomadura sp. GC306]
MGCEPRRFDLTMLHAAYDAFRRDTARLAAAARADGAPVDAATMTTWSLFTSHWRVQDHAEKNALWTVMYAKDADAPGRLGVVLDAMALRAVKVVPLIDAVDAALEHRDRLMFARYAPDLHAAVNALLDHKESDVLPLIPDTLTAFEWGTFDVEFRRETGMRGLGVFLPWLLDGAPEPTRRAVLALLPPPIRLCYRTSWRPRYRRRFGAAVPAC